MSSFAIKLIAVITMLTDHMGVAFERVIPYETYLACRLLGRLAMPLFCFLIAEGLLKTRSAKKYLARLLMFALISEIPFDLLVGHSFWDASNQNVFFTLFLGLLGIMLFDQFMAMNRRFPALLAIMGCGLTAELISSDYSVYGVYFIFVFYYARGNIKLLSALFALGAAAFASSLLLTGNKTAALLTLTQMAALPAVFRYNGKKGFSKVWLKRAFYAFYPAHMLLLAAARYFINMRGV